MSAAPFFRLPTWSSLDLPEPTIHKFRLRHDITRDIRLPSNWVDESRVPLLQVTDFPEVLDAFADICSKTSDFLSNAHRASRCFRYSFATFFPSQGMDQDAPTHQGFTPINHPDPLSLQMEHLALDGLTESAQYVLRLNYANYGEILDDFDNWNERVRNSATALSDTIRTASASLSTSEAHCPIFWHYWRSCLGQVYGWAQYVHESDTFDTPTVPAVLNEIASMVPMGEKVCVLAEVGFELKVVAFLTRDHVEYPNNGSLMNAINDSIVRTGDINLGGLSVQEG